MTAVDTHSITRDGRAEDTIVWLNGHGYRGTAVLPSEGIPGGLLFRSAATPNEPPKLAVVGDTLVADGPYVTIADPTLKGLTR